MGKVEVSLRWFVSQVTCSFHHVDRKDSNKSEQEDKMDDPEWDQDPIVPRFVAVHDCAVAVKSSKCSRRPVYLPVSLPILYITERVLQRKKWKVRQAYNMHVWQCTL